MNPQSGSEPRSSGGVIWLAALLGVAPAAWFDSRVLAGYVTVVAAAGAAFALRWWLGIPAPAQVSTGISAGLFPVAALQYGERGVFWALSASLLIVAVGMVLARPGRGALGLMAAQLLLTISAGYIGAFVVLIRLTAGSAVLLSVLVMLVVYSAVLRLRVASAVAPAGPWVAAFGVCVAAGAVSLALGGIRVGTSSSLMLGAAVGLAATLGAAAAPYVGGRDASEVLQPLLSALVAIPIFFYGLTLFLR
ncbi:MAG: hypothetical protein KY393_03335 [Actinobacteria bacterium]|nr:hypothetical protein [Actinomycetota bacterium]